MGEVHFCLPGMNGFHAKAKNESFTAVGSRCGQNLKHEYFMLSFGRLHQKIEPKSVSHIDHDYFPSFKFGKLILSTLPLHNMCIQENTLSLLSYRASDILRSHGPVKFR